MITLSTFGWSDVFDDYPLKYSFYQVVETPSGVIDIPIDPLPQTRGEISFIAPAVENDTVITFKVIAFDNKNSAITNVTVRALKKQSGEIKLKLDPSALMTSTTDCCAFMDGQILI